MAAEAATAFKEQRYWVEQSKLKERAPPTDSAMVAAATRGGKASGGIINKLWKAVGLRGALQALHRTKLLGRAQKALRIQNAKERRLKERSRERRRVRQAEEDKRSEDAAEFPQILAAKRRAAAAIGELCRRP